MKAPTKRAQEVVDFAVSHGFSVRLTKRSHLRFSRPGYPPVFTGGSPSDRRAVLNAKATLRRVLRTQQSEESPCN